MIDTTRPQPKPAEDLARRLARVEARLVALMRFLGMKTDGHRPLKKGDNEP
jgi:hypothetical protein